MYMFFKIGWLVSVYIFSPQAQIFDGLEEDSFSFGNDTFQPRKSVKKLTLKKISGESGTPSRASSMIGEPPNVSSLRDEGNYGGR